MPFAGLADSTMRTLSQIVNERDIHGAGNGLLALERRGYVVELDNPIRSRRVWRTHRATPAGIAFLARARRAGW